MSSNSSKNQKYPEMTIPKENTRTTKEECDLCGGQNFDVIATFDRHGQPLGTGICTDCGLVAHTQRPTDKELSEFYTNEYRQEYHGETIPSSRRIMRAWKNGQRIFSQLTPYLKSNDKIFEVGAGIGCTVKQFEKQGYESSGIEPHEGFQSFSVEKLQTKVTQRNLFDLSQKSTYDFILLIHVIEHFNSPRNALEHIHGLLKPGGHLYVECPNLEAPFARRSKLFHYAHIHNFTPTSLAMMARRCGFIVESQFGHESDPNLQMLLIRADDVDMTIDKNNYRKTLRSLKKYNLLTYHLRWNYLCARLNQVTSYLSEFLTARLYTKKILQECAFLDQDHSDGAVIEDSVATVKKKKAA